MISILHNITKLKGMGNLFTKWGWANQPYLQLRAKLHELRRTQLNLIESKLLLLLLFFLFNNGWPFSELQLIFKGPF
jgi:hypothetical protein